MTTERKLTIQRVQDMPSPQQLWKEQADAASRFAFTVSVSGGLRAPWPTVDRLIGMPFLPGWLVLVGGRAKHGKSTFARGLFQSWVELGKRVLYVGSEQAAHILRLLWGANRCNAPAKAAIDPNHPMHATVMEDVQVGQRVVAEQAIITADSDLTMPKFVDWCRYGYKHKCDAIILDHFHRMNGHSHGDLWQSRGEDVRGIKNVAENSGMVIVAAAQLRNGEGGHLLGEYQIPGPSSWAETPGLRREADVAIQVWRPFKPGIKSKDKDAAKDDPGKLGEIVHHRVMGVRLDAHRYSEDLDPSNFTRLTVQNGELVTWHPDPEQGELGAP